MATTQSLNPLPDKTLGIQYDPNVKIRRGSSWREIIAQILKSEPAKMIGSQLGKAALALLAAEPQERADVWDVATTRNHITTSLRALDGSIPPTEQVELFIRQCKDALQCLSSWPDSTIPGDVLSKCFSTPEVQTFEIVSTPQKMMRMQTKTAC